MRFWLRKSQTGLFVIVCLEGFFPLAPQRVERQNAHSLRDVVRFLVDVDGLGNMPSNRRAVPRQSGKTLPDRLLCAVICGDIHTIGLKRESDGLFPDAGERNRQHGRRGTAGHGAAGQGAARQARRGRARRGEAWQAG